MSCTISKEEISVDRPTVYLYDKGTGRVQYTIEDVNPAQIQSFKEKNLSYYVGPAGQRISGTFVKVDPSTGNPVGISPFQHMTFININKHTIVANGTDEAVISGLPKGMSVNINDEYQYIVDDESGSTLELTCNNYSYLPQHNQMIVYFKQYGHHDSSIKVNVVEG